MSTDNRLQYLRSVAGEIPVIPYERALHYCEIATKLLEAAESCIRFSQLEDAYILLWRLSSIFTSRFRSHPEYLRLSKNALKKIEIQCEVAHKLRLKVESELSGKILTKPEGTSAQLPTSIGLTRGLPFSGNQVSRAFSPAMKQLKKLLPIARTKTELRRADEWMQKVFTELTSISNGLLDEAGVQNLILKLNGNYNEIEASILYNDFKVITSAGKEGINLEGVAWIINAITRYTMLEGAFRQYEVDSYINLDGLKRLLQGQGDDFREYSDSDYLKLIEDCNIGTTSRKGQLSLKGFTNMLLSSSFDALRSSHHQLCQDMSKPLCNYFIASSHNTYLTGNQLTSNSSVEAYSLALRRGCRCVELDCWDGGGDEGPLIHHGGTLTSSITFKDVLQKGIKPHAFSVSQYPVILSLENHCGQIYQNRMAHHLKTILGALIYTRDENNLQELPSPQELKGKIIIKASKRLKLSDAFRSFVNISTVDDIDYDSDENVSSVSRLILDNHDSVAVEQSQNKESLIRPKPIALDNAELNAMVNICQAVKFASFENSKSNGKFYHMSSFVESKAKRLGDKNPLDFIKYNQRQLSRIYPMGMRAMSSNLDPTIFWKFGCQIVALNYQTKDKMNLINQYLFSDNGNCGYILKPPLLTDPNTKFDPTKKNTKVLNNPQVIRLTVMGALYLPHTSGKNHPSWPCVEIEVIGFDHDRQSYITPEVQNNGLNPVWNSVFELRVHTPEYAIIVFTIHDKSITGMPGTSPKDDIAHGGVPVSALGSGYRHVKLTNREGESLFPAALFIHVEKMPSI